MFNDFRERVRQNLKRLEAAGKILYADIDRDGIWEAYLSGFDDPIERQGHNCNCCKSFLRQYGGAVAVTEDLQVLTLWDGIELPAFAQAAANLRAHVLSKTVNGQFLVPSQSCGTEQNFDMKRQVTWTHFHMVVPRASVCCADEIDTQKARFRSSMQVFERLLKEIPVETTETVLDLIAQNALYRGAESKEVLTEVLSLQKAYRELPEESRPAFVLRKATHCRPGVLGLRNTAIGTLLVDLAAGEDLDRSVRSFETKVAPTNYQRPTSIVTPKMVEAAKAQLTELGLLASLERRFASPTDVTADNVLFVDRSHLTPKDVFDEVAKDTPVSAKSLGKVDTVTIEKFLSDIVPTVNSLELLLERRHLPNMVTLIAPTDPTSKSLFKWPNGFSWAYTGGVADSIKERVKAAGGKVDGVLRISLSWHNYDDLDLHVLKDRSPKICFSNKSSFGGVLDVDMNAGTGTSRTPVENVTWAKMPPKGMYSVKVHNFSRRENVDSGYTVEIEYDGTVWSHTVANSPSTQAFSAPIEFTFDPVTGVTMHTQLHVGSGPSTQKWGLSTDRFHKVTRAMLSPNHWGEAQGNRHFMFFLEGCVSDEKVRPIFNEFLTSELQPHRKVLETVGSRLEVAPSTDQLSGLGFSDTQRNDFLVRVGGSFKRVIRVTI